MAESREPLIILGSIGRRKFIKYGSLALGASVVTACTGGGGRYYSKCLIGWLTCFTIWRWSQGWGLVFHYRNDRDC
jgi:hypothetical protein